jgi:Zn-dependent oligopeptidase
VVSKYKAKNEPLQGEQKRLFTKIVETFERNGLGLDEPRQNELKELKTSTS